MKCIILAGPNGAGKTTFARQLLPALGVLHFVNADLIAAGLCPLKPELAKIPAGRLFLTELDRLAAAKTDFAFETTLSGINYVKRLQAWKHQGYAIHLHFLTLSSAALAMKRIAERVQQGGHYVPDVDVIRRFERGKTNFNQYYRELADQWWIYDNSGSTPRLLEAGP